MNPEHLSENANFYLHTLCLDLPSRRVGGRGNQSATDFFAEKIASFGFQTETPQFGCIDWTHGDVHLTVGGELFAAYISPYSLGCRVSAPLVTATTIDELDAIDATGKAILLRGELTKEQLMPKNFVFYNPVHHRRLVSLLEAKAPAAIIAATTSDPGLAGGISPFPLIEDGDFDIPSVYITEDEGVRLAEYVGREVSLEMEARRIPSTGSNVIARKGKDAGHRIVVCAHIDAKDGTPGAIDNASGTVVLLLLAELLQDYDGDLMIEIVSLNGEDYYSAPGEMQFLLLNEGKSEEIILGINLDGPGYKIGKTAYTLYDIPDTIANAATKVFSSYEDIIEGEPWYQSDHSIFIQNGRPAMAITSDRFMELSTNITHTSKDHPDIVDTRKLVTIAQALRDLLLAEGAFDAIGG